MIKIINLNVILFSLAIAYGILKIIDSYNDKKMEYSVGSEESLPEQISLADIADKLAEWWPPSDELNVEKDMTDELNAEKDMTEYDNDFFRKFILRFSFRYRFDRCVYKETEDESCKNGAVDLGIDKICCNIRVWNFKDDIYYNHVPNSNITINDKTYEHDFIDCVGGKYNSNGYYHINKFKIDCEKVVCTVKRYFHSGMDYWFLPVDTDFSCKLNVRRIAEWDDFLSNYNDIVERYSRSVAKYSVEGGWGPFSKKDDVTNTVAEIEELDLGGSISLHDEWNDEELKDYLRRAKRTPDVISEKVLPIHQLIQNNVKSNVEKPR